MSSVCEHGSLARSCEVCELKAELAEARKEYKAVRGLLDNQCRATSKAAKERDEAREELDELEQLIDRYRGYDPKVAAIDAALAQSAREGCAQ